MYERRVNYNAVEEQHLKLLILNLDLAEIQPKLAS